VKRLRTVRPYSDAERTGPNRPLSPLCFNLPWPSTAGAFVPGLGLGRTSSRRPEGDVRYSDPLSCLPHACADRAAHRHNQICIPTKHILSASVPSMHEVAQVETEGRVGTQRRQLKIRRRPASRRPLRDRYPLPRVWPSGTNNGLLLALPLPDLRSDLAADLAVGAWRPLPSPGPVTDGACGCPSLVK
jgi:hypothetical protein